MALTGLKAGVPGTPIGTKSGGLSTLKQGVKTNPTTNTSAWYNSIFGDNSGGNWIENSQNSGSSGGSSGSGGGSSSSGSYNSSNSYTDYLAALQAAKQAKIEAANAAIDQQAQAAEQKYNNQLNQVLQDYQSLKNQSEVERYKAQKSLRETQANRGALNSGVGRQEGLTLQNNYGNNLMKIGQEEEREKNDIYSAINEMWAEAQFKKAQNEIAAQDDTSSILTSLLSSGAYSYDPATSDYYNTAKNSIVSGSNAYSSAAADALASKMNSENESEQQIAELKNQLGSAKTNGSLNKTDIDRLKGLVSGWYK